MAEAGQQERTFFTNKMKRYKWTFEKMEALYFLRRIAKAYIKMNELLKT